MIHDYPDAQQSRATLGIAVVTVSCAGFLVKIPVLLLFFMLVSTASSSAIAQNPIGARLDAATDIYSAFSPRLLVEADEAAMCFRRARTASEQGDVGAALRLATQAMAADPEHVEARRVLGYRKVGEQWAGTYAARRLERGEIWHADFGWIRAEEVSSWEAGERRMGNRWISAEDDARRHASIDRGWKIRTDHFHVVTNHSREAASELATRLEILYQLWQQLFGGFYLDASDLMKRFEGKESSGYRGKPFLVNYYRTREEYNAALRRLQPQIEMTLGIYFDSNRQTHFFAGKEQDAGTIYHEAVHQFFQESRPAARHVGALANAWIIEGTACYFESLVEHRDANGRRYFTVGTADAGRLPAAQHRRLVDDFYIPLAELSALGMTDLQSRDDLARLYSQSAGLATFLMHGRNGQYRPALVKLMQEIYAGRDKATSLQDLTGQSFTELDNQYLEFLERLPRESASSSTP